MLEIDFRASSVKIGQQLVTGEPFLDGVPQLRFLDLCVLNQNLLLAIKLEVTDQIAVKVCTRQVLEIDYPASNVKLGQQLDRGDVLVVAPTLAIDHQGPR